eukprot:3085653-Rhodomonas_salina.2
MTWHCTRSSPVTSACVSTLKLQLEVSRGRRSESERVWMGFTHQVWAWHANSRHDNRGGSVRSQSVKLSLRISDSISRRRCSRAVWYTPTADSSPRTPRYTPTAPAPDAVRKTGRSAPALSASHARSSPTLSTSPHKGRPCLSRHHLACAAAQTTRKATRQSVGLAGL